MVHSFVLMMLRWARTATAAASFRSKISISQVVGGVGLRLGRDCRELPLLRFTEVTAGHVVLVTGPFSLFHLDVFSDTAALAPASKGLAASSNRDTCTADHWLTAELLHNAGAISANELNTVIGRAAAIIDQPEVAGEPREDKQPNLGGRGVPHPTFELSLIRGAKLVAEFSKLARSPQNAPFAPLPFVLGGRWINKLIESLACQVGGLRSSRGTPWTGW